MSGTKKTVKRGFGVLDREKALKAAAGAVGLLRKIFKDATKAAVWRGSVLEGVETELSELLLFSSAKRLADGVLGDVEPVAVPADLGKARNSAAGAVKVLRNILKDARADLSVGESRCHGLNNALDHLEEALNDLLPPPGAPPKPRLPDNLFEDAAVPVDTGDG
jgi:hypothetical protein